MERENYKPSIEEMIISIIDSSIPIAKSFELGHGEDCKCIIIGKHYSLKNKNWKINFQFYFIHIIAIFRYKFIYNFT